MRSQRSSLPRCHLRCAERSLTHVTLFGRLTMEYSARWRERIAVTVSVRFPLLGRYAVIGERQFFPPLLFGPFRNFLTGGLGRFAIPLPGEFELKPPHGALAFLSGLAVRVRGSVNHDFTSSIGSRRWTDGLGIGPYCTSQMCRITLATSARLNFGLASRASAMALTSGQCLLTRSRLCKKQNFRNAV